MELKYSSSKSLTSLFASKSETGDQLEYQVWILQGKMLSRWNIWTEYMGYLKGHIVCFIKESYYRQESHPSSPAPGTQRESML